MSAEARSPNPRRRHLVAGLVATATSLALPRASRGATHVYDIRRFGAVGNGRTLSTAAIQRALDACGKAGGGVVLVPPGHYLTGALFLRSNLELHISRGAVLMGSPRFEDYPAIITRSEGIERNTYASLLTGIGLENVAITGGGVLDGQGPPWWRAQDVTRQMRNDRNLPREADNPEGAPLRWPRPRVINLIRCQGVAVRDICVRESPYWSVHFVYCQDVVVDGITIVSLQAQHIDGVIVDSCKHVRISNSSISAGSDSIALKSGYNEQGRKIGLPCDNVIITNCNLSFSVGAGISLGSETAGDIRNVTIDNCTIERCRFGVHVRSPRGRGGVVERVRMSNLLFDKIEEIALLITHFYDSVRMDSLFGERSKTGNPETDRTLVRPVDEGTPTFRDIEFSSLTVGAAPVLAVVEGLPERFIRGLVIRDVTAPAVKSGVLIARAADVTISRVRMNPVDGPAVAAREVEGLQVEGLSCPRPSPKVPIVRLEDASGVFIHGNDIGAGATEFVRTEGQRNRRLNVTGNNLPAGLKTPGT
jgi:polygalacturonase